MTPNNQRQAYMPEGAIRVKNPNGTAPCFIVEDPRVVVYCLPGVPVELKWLFENEVEPYLRKKFNLAEVIHYRVLKIVGVGESAVDDKVGHLIANSSNPTVGVLALPGQVDVRIAAKAANRSPPWRQRFVAYSVARYSPSMTKRWKRLSGIYCVKKIKWWLFTRMSLAAC